jgi:DNA replication protein DnaC
VTNKLLSKRFFDKNYKIILEGNCSAFRVSDLLTTFFGKKVAKTVKYKDVALGLVKYLFEKGVIFDQNKLNSVCNHSDFLKKYIKLPLEKIVEKSLKSNPISEEEIKAIDSRKALEYIKESSRKEIEDDINDIKKKREELLKSLPSILDSECFEEPKQDTEIYKNKEVWWQKLNLISDPFPTQNGLSKIDKKMYEDVVIKTDSFKKIVNLFKQDPKNFFNKGTLLSGGFGTGKTTIVDYLGYFIKENYNYASLTITFDQQRDVIDYIKRFKFELLKELKKISNQFDIEIDSLSPDLENDIPLLIMELAEHNIDGIIVFIDDLHKHNDQNLIFDFNL